MIDWTEQKDRQLLLREEALILARAMNRENLEQAYASMLANLDFARQQVEDLRRLALRL